MNRGNPALWRITSAISG